MWSIHTKEYYSTSKRKDTVTPGPTGMNFEDMMLSERSQTQKDKYCMSPLIRGP